MKINIVPIGNSKGVRIPKAILQQCRLDKCADMEVKNCQIIIKPYKEKPRKNWEAAFEDMRKNKDDGLIITDHIDLDILDWSYRGVIPRVFP
jgi:antitoxin MazE